MSNNNRKECLITLHKQSDGGTFHNVQLRHDLMNGKWPGI